MGRSLGMTSSRESPATRTTAALEAVTGQIYLTVLVARLVGLHIVHATRLRSDDKD
jgi:hypothetical protein